MRFREVRRKLLLLGKMFDIHEKKQKKKKEILLCDQYETYRGVLIHSMLNASVS